MKIDEKARETSRICEGEEGDQPGDIGGPSLALRFGLYIQSIEFQGNIVNHFTIDPLLSLLSDGNFANSMCRKSLIFFWIESSP